MTVGDDDDRLAAREQRVEVVRRQPWRVAWYEESTLCIDLPPSQDPERDRRALAGLVGVVHDVRAARRRPLGDHRFGGNDDHARERIEATQHLEHVAGHRLGEARARLVVERVA